MMIIVRICMTAIAVISMHTYAGDIVPCAWHKDAAFDLHMLPQDAINMITDHAADNEIALLECKKVVSSVNKRLANYYGGFMPLLKGRNPEHTQALRGMGINFSRADLEDRYTTSYCDGYFNDYRSLFVHHTLRNLVKKSSVINIGNFVDDCKKKGIPINFNYTFYKIKKKQHIHAVPYTPDIPNNEYRYQPQHTLTLGSTTSIYRSSLFSFTKHVCVESYLKKRGASDQLRDVLLSCPVVEATTTLWDMGYQKLFINETELSKEGIEKINDIFAQHKKYIDYNAIDEYDDIFWHHLVKIHRPELYDSMQYCINSALLESAICDSNILHHVINNSAINSELIVNILKKDEQFAAAIAPCDYTLLVNKPFGTPKQTPLDMVLDRIQKRDSEVIQLQRWWDIAFTLLSDKNIDLQQKTLHDLVRHMVLPNAVCASEIALSPMPDEFKEHIRTSKDSSGNTPFADLFSGIRGNRMTTQGRSTLLLIDQPLLRSLLQQGFMAIDDKVYDLKLVELADKRFPGEKPCQPKKDNSQGYTYPLHAVIKEMHKYKKYHSVCDEHILRKLLRLLMKEGADPFAQDSQGKTAHTLARNDKKIKSILSAQK